ncbi:MarR family transcriptional regulator [Limosilactobacillus sp. Lr3000]|uniref:MarR family transcriptional regulator n=2 Tax=Limosilactobacillus albertensis TaxID=2759752 RepID=A0A839HB50_9LACO|nr:MarR family transcriptional regulator [Limosilactobacillus albertensis]
MKIEKLWLAITLAGKGYATWSAEHGMNECFSTVLCELYLNPGQSQHQLIDHTGYPKQSVNKAIKQLLNKNYLTMTMVAEDKRVKRCTLTPLGRTFAENKLTPLFELEEKTVKQFGTEKMNQLVHLQEQWGQLFWNNLQKEKINK